MFRKRADTSGIRGQLYETKLISLLYFRAIQDDTIEEFQLASNIDGIGAFDDICFKAKVKDYEKPIAVFIQAKHRENKKQPLKYDLVTYFDSYLKIRHQFDPNNTDLFFNGTFDETECVFVIYTTAQDDFDNNSAESGFLSNLYGLINTGGTAKRPYNKEEDVEFLCKTIIKDHMISLAERIVKFVHDDKNFQMMMSDELVLRYHVILERTVVEVSEIQPVQGNVPRYRIATFRQDFFDNDDEYIVVFRDILYQEIIKLRRIHPTNARLFLSEFLGDSSEPSRLSKLIGTVITYKNGQLEFDEHYTVDRPHLKPMEVSRSIVNKAVELAAKEILASRMFKVPTAFGNKDLTITGSGDKIERRINHLASKLKELLDSCNSTMVDIDKSLGNGLLQLNGGLAGAIGNIFVLDDNTNLLKITDDWEALGVLAQRLHKKLIDEIHNLHEYKFCVKINRFPKLAFDCNEHEKSLSRDFLNKLLFYSEQADEKGVEVYLKEDIEEYQRDHPNYYQVKTDAIFLKYHDKIQEWWMQTKEASYLTRECDYFTDAINNIIIDPLMSAVSVTYMNKIKKYVYKFNKDAVESLNLQEEHLKTVIITENSALTVVKVLQLLKNKDRVVLDFEYVTQLPKNDQNALRTELKNTSNKKYLIFVCDIKRYTRNEKKILENIAEAVSEKKTIVITNKMALEIVNEYFPKQNNIVQDKRNRLIDISEESQKRVMSTNVIFQDREISLGVILDGESINYVKGDILNKIISDDTLSFGNLTVNRNYNEIKHLYVDRRVKKMGSEADIVVKTLKDIPDDVVLITAEPGMGKTTLLTHLSLKTKEVEPEVWIVRINLLEYSREFSKWNEQVTIIDSLESLKFMCHVILCEKYGDKHNVEIELQEENGNVKLSGCSGDQSTEFELKMFLHHYNKGRMVFLFDGFDEICPHYANVVVQCINTVSIVPGKHRKWITSRSYNEVKTILQRYFGSSYEIDYFSNTEMEIYLETFWDCHLILEELNSSQLENVKNFIEYMLQTANQGLHCFTLPLHQVYNNAAYYLINEIKFKQIPLWTYGTNYDDTHFVQEKNDDFVAKYHEGNSDGNPLHLYLAAIYFENSIKSENTDIKKWNLEVNAYTFYERFMETKMKTIRFEEKSRVDTDISDVKITYENELADFILKHKQLAAYTIFNSVSHILFSREDMEDIEEMIRFIEKGGEKTGLIYRVANGIPIFIHMTFTEYFAVEYVCDRLKKESHSDKIIPWMDFIFNVLFSMASFMYIRNIFDYRIINDKTLMRILENNKDVIFNLLMEQGKVYSEITSKKTDRYLREGNYWALTDAIQQELSNFVSFFVKILECYLNKSNLNDFLDIVKGSQLLLIAHKCKMDVLKFVIDIVRQLDDSKLTTVLHDNFAFISDSVISRCVEMSHQRVSSEEIVQILLEQNNYLEPLEASATCPPPSACNEDWHFSIYGLSKQLYPSSLTSQGSNSRRLSTPSLPSTASNSSLASGISLTSLNSLASISSLPRRLSSSSLPSQASKSNLPRRLSISSMPSQGSTSSVPRRKSLTSLP